ncbi:unnamed protein product [Microthlaspi erraticum]|uniref:Phytochelatin synthase C-terminal domain-containing protein n=1 Tax=Microthlaspi erraticum TaxID=1685480 RepID=A0A6D2HFR8_9BRAS|nr:unnamed protein product [Microthlaspi erraticum]CAA7040547.1 unnamed protein product [Microthlaspi erraticum]
MVLPSLCMQELLKQVHETQLFKHIDKFLSVVGYQDNLPYAAAKAVSQGAQILWGTELDELCCHETCVKCIKGHHGEETATVGSLLHLRKERVPHQ